MVQRHGRSSSHETRCKICGKEFKEISIECQLGSEFHGFYCSRRCCDEGWKRFASSRETKNI